ncbi:glyoxalase family protein [Paraburkholderia steynii]|uniref:Glyoxalase family protein n=1 Tax=Paraburkholderia steynii TaxID=1245441 RepID=A0A7Z7FJ89_9BURK|nr:VOC family protein [Paraburkholderia steynii]SDI50609.1 glyoxalase family protein [Paraburkholderia steynii]
MTKSDITIHRHHHITLCVGGAQEDYDFHTKVLSLKSVKKTALYDGTFPIYHLYYGNDTGEESTLVTTFPMRQSGRKARPGAGQISTLSLSVPVSALGFWRKRLSDHGFASTYSERFGEEIVSFSHPCGIEYELIGIADDSRTAYSNGEVPADLGIRGTHGITLKVRELEPSEEFMASAWSGREVARDGKYVRFSLGDGGPGAFVEFALEPDLPQSSWTYGEGIVHHCAFQVADFAAQDAVKARLEGLGFTDTSERKDRGYFDSIYVRTPGGGMFEATVSKPQGFAIDEPIESLGTSFKVPPVFASRREEIMGFLEPLNY